MKFTPLRISLIYFFFALVWITITDQLLDWWVDDAQLLSLLQTIKGFFYVSMTAIALYVMIKSYERFLGKNKELLEKQEKSLNLALNSANMATWEYDVSEDSYTSSDNHNELFGYHKSEKLTLQKVYNRIHYEDIDGFKNIVKETLEKGESFDKTFRVTLPNGKERWLWSKAELTSNGTHKKIVRGVTMNVSESKQLEYQLALQKERLEILFERIPVLINIYDREQNLISYNSYHEEVLGWNYEDLENKNLLELCYPDPEYRKIVISNIIQRPKGWKEFSVRTKSGENRKQMWTNIKLSDDTFVGVGYDVTEQRKLENRLKQEREELQQIFDTMPVFINLHEHNKQFGQVNRYFEETFGPIDNKENDTEVLKRITSDNIYEKAKNKIGNPDGEWTDFELIDKNGNRISTTWINIQLNEAKAIGIGLDLTDRIKLEQSIEESRERLQLTTRSANIGLWEWHPKTGTVVIDEIWANLVGYTLEELEPVSIETWNKLVYPEDLKKFERTVEEYFRGETDSYECEVRMRHKDGHLVWILDRGKIIDWYDDGSPKRLAGTHVDITDRVKAEQENKMLANVYRHSNTALGVSNHITGELERVNKSFAELFGYEVHEMIGLPVKELYAPDSVEDLNRVPVELSEYGETILETNLIKKNKEKFSAIVNLSLVKDSENGQQFRISTVQDITHIKQQQAELQRSRDRLLQTQQIARLGYWTLHIEQNTLWWSDIVYDIYGRKKDNFIPTLDNYIECTHPDDRDDVQKAVDKFAKNEGFQLTHRILKPDGTTGFVQVRGEKMYDGVEQAWVINGSTIDITEIKQIEKELEEQQQRFLIAANISSDVIWEWNPAKNELWWGEGVETVLGYKPDDYKNDSRFWHKKIAEEDQDRVISSMEQAEEQGKTYWEEEYWFYDAKGNKKRIADSALIIRNKKGEITRIIGAMVDKTKELEYREMLKHQSRKFEMIAKSSNDVLYEWNIKTDEVWWSEGWQTKFHFDKEDIQQTFHWWSKNIHPDYKNKIIESITTAITEKKDSWYEYYKFKNGKGTYSIVIDKGYFLKDGEDITHMVGTISDITEEVHAREELKASEEQYRLLFEQSPLSMYIYDPNTLQIVTANNSAVEKYGYSIEELKSMKIYELHPSDDRPEVKKEIKKSLAKDRTGFDIWTQINKKGDKIISEISGTDIYYDGKNQRLVIANDITTQKKAEERAISAIIDGEERERERIAKELHDGLGQYLSASNMNLKSVYEDLDNLPEKLKGNFKTGLDLLGNAISETRNISQNLLPKAIQDYGLELAAESLINHLKSNSDITFSYYKNVDGIDISNKVQINLYRILQEALNNAIRHGSPTRIDIQLVFSDGELLMVVEDNGTGFDKNNISGEGLGLRSMKTRVGAMAANLDITSSKDKGTIISVVVPLNDNPHQV